MTDLIDQIKAARQELRRRENEASDAGFTLRACKEQEKKARGELDKLLDELETGRSRYPLPGFDRLEIPGSNGNGTPDEHQRGRAPEGVGEFPASTVSVSGGKPKREAK